MSERPVVMTPYLLECHSCETTLLRLAEDWKLAMDSEQFIGILSTDMSKAFDSLYPSLMINKLKAYDFSEESLGLMRSYFSNRQNRVKLNGVTSSWKDAVRGCPQGSSFGPLLWNIFQNDITYIVNNASLSIYVDDRQVYVKGYSVDCVEQLLTNGGRTISKWYKDNFLKGNYDKYNLMLLGRKNKNEDSQSLNVNIVWHFCKASDARKLERVQERALRAVYNDRNAMYEELLEKERLCSLENRQLQDILILMYKVKNSLAPEHVCNMFFQKDKH